jgi:glycosyltransferase involved in cell wall biosynthesis
MKVSIITTTFNTGKTVEDTINSVLSQTYPDIEYIIVDDQSTDNTLDIVNKFKDRVTKIVYGEHNGIFGALNKGLEFVTGDIVAILNSDDFYISNDVIETVVNEFKNTGADCVWGDLVIVDKDDVNKIVRNWKSSAYKEESFQKGWHPPHPTFFVKREIYDKYGLFRTDFSTAGDFELVLRFLEKYKISSSYIPKVLTKMRAGGQSNKSIYNHLRAIWFSYKAFKINNIKVSPFFIIRKPLFKIKQFFGN